MEEPSKSSQFMSETSLEYQEMLILLGSSEKKLTLFAWRKTSTTRTPDRCFGDFQMYILYRQDGDPNPKESGG